MIFTTYTTRAKVEEMQAKVGKTFWVKRPGCDAKVRARLTSACPYNQVKIRNASGSLIPHAMPALNWEAL